MKAGRPRAAAGVAAVALGALALTSSGAAGTAIKPAAGVPDPRLMVLTAADLRGAKVTSQGYYKDKDFPSVISYGREFENARVGSVGVPYADSEAEVGTSVRTTAQFLAGFRAYARTKQAKKAIADGFKDSFPLPGVVTRVVVGNPRDLGLGPGSFDLPVTLRILGVRTEFHLSAFRVEQVLGGIVVVGTPGKRVPLATMTGLGRVMAGRMTAQLSPRSTSPPTISGTAAVGQTLTVAPGSWTNKPTTFAYQWQRCDAAGAGCVDLAGATGETYTVGEGDLGATLRTRVVATNAAGSSTAFTTATAVVVAAGVPVSTSPPTISGTAAVGQTLTGSTGAWTGSPTSFEFQWQRCQVVGGVTGTCTDVTGATGGVYVVSDADRGVRLRLVVRATNDVGSVVAASEPTATVP